MTQHHKPNFFAHPNSIVEAKHIGSGTRVWAFSHILPDARIGEDCNICDHVFIENEVVVGNRVTVKSGVQLWDGIVLEDGVFVGPNATFTIDPFPRSKQYPESFSKTVVQNAASIGANATILPGLTIGRNAMVGAGAVVTNDVPPNAIVVGNPAYIKGYVNTRKTSGMTPKTPNDDRESAASVRGVTVHDLPLVTDLRGNLSVAEVGKGLPFRPDRYFLVFDVPNREVRGEHAHRSLEQFLVCVKGDCAVIVDDGVNREEISLDRPNRGIHIGPMVWGIQYHFSPDAILLVLASEPYDPDDYIREYDEFTELAAAGRDHHTS